MTVAEPRSPAAAQNSLIAGSNDGTIRWWNSGSLRFPTTSKFKLNDQVQAVGISPDGRTIVSGEEFTVQRWNAETGGRIGMPINAQDMVFRMAFSPDGRIFATLGLGGVVLLWDAGTGVLWGKPIIARPGILADLVISTDQRIVAGESQTIRSDVGTQAPETPSATPLAIQFPATKRG